jgi:hypothetical protein
MHVIQELRSTRTEMQSPARRAACRSRVAQIAAEIRYRCIGALKKIVSGETVTRSCFQGRLTDFRHATFVGIDFLAARCDDERTHGFMKNVLLSNSRSTSAHQ